MGSVQRGIVDRIAGGILPDEVLVAATHADHRSGNQKVAGFIGGDLGVKLTRSADGEQPMYPGKAGHAGYIPLGHMPVVVTDQRLLLFWAPDKRSPLQLVAGLTPHDFQQVKKFTTPIDESMMVVFIDGSLIDLHLPSSNKGKKVAKAANALKASAGYT